VPDGRCSIISYIIQILRPRTKGINTAETMHWNSTTGDAITMAVTTICWVNNWVLARHRFRIIVTILTKLKKSDLYSQTVSGTYLSFKEFSYDLKHMHCNYVEHCPLSGIFNLHCVSAFTLFTRSGVWLSLHRQIVFSFNFISLLCQWQRSASSFEPSECETYVLTIR
jgi:hypothetical protein